MTRPRQRAILQQCKQESQGVRRKKSLRPTSPACLFLTPLPLQEATNPSIRQAIHIAKYPLRITALSQARAEDSLASRTMHAACILEQNPSSSYPARRIPRASSSRVFARTCSRAGGAAYGLVRYDEMRAAGARQRNAWRGCRGEEL